MHRSLLVSVLCALVPGLCSCRPTATRSNVILVVVDTMRADRLGVYGNPRGLTPFMDGLANKGVVFKNAYAASSWTVPSVASLFTSRFPSQHHVTTSASKIGETEVTLAERFQAAGYETGGVQANFRLTKALGYAQGFDSWKVLFVAGVKARGDRVRAVALDWVGNRDPESKQPARFLFLQYMEPHSPYEPLPPYRARFERHDDGVDPARANVLLQTLNFRACTPGVVDVLESLYDGEVASVDNELQALFAELEKRGFLRNSVVVITADHGEEFKEHGGMSHGQTLYNEAVRVPLIVVAPGLEAGKVIENNVSLIDVAPTLLELAGLPPQESFEGHSLLPLIKPRSMMDWLFSVAEPPPDMITELLPTGSAMDFRAHSRSLLRGSNKLLMSLRGPQRTEVPELYDLITDPNEQTPLAAPPELAATLRSRSDALARRAGARAETGLVDDATKEKLRALGYHF